MRIQKKEILDLNVSNVQKLLTGYTFFKPLTRNKLKTKELGADNPPTNRQTENKLKHKRNKRQNLTLAII